MIGILEEFLAMLIYAGVWNFEQFLIFPLTSKSDYL
jgi:hypothetical protein